MPRRTAIWAAELLTPWIRFEEALASYDRAIALKPDHAEALYNRALTRLGHLARYEDALAGYDQALALQADELREQCCATHAPPETLCYLQRYAGGDRRVSPKAIALQPDYAEAYSNRGVTLTRLQRHADALASYDRAIALESDQAVVYSQRGHVLADLQRHAEALASCDLAIAIKPDDPEAHASRGAILARQQRHTDALASCDRAIALRPGYPDAY